MQIHRSSHGCVMIFTKDHRRCPPMLSLESQASFIRWHVSLAFLLNKTNCLGVKIIQFHLHLFFQICSKPDQQLWFGDFPTKKQRVLANPRVSCKLGALDVRHVWIYCLVWFRFFQPWNETSPSLDRNVFGKKRSHVTCPLFLVGVLEIPDFHRIL